MECPICYDTIDNENFVKTKCKHTFHKTCLHIWNNSSNTCPFCRAIIQDSLNFIIGTIYKVNYKYNSNYFYGTLYEIYKQENGITRYTFKDIYNSLYVLPAVVFVFDNLVDISHVI